MSRLDAFRRPAMVMLGLAMLLALVVDARPARAAFPGANGRIAFSSHYSNINSINADGTERRSLVAEGTTGGGRSPAYSPDGTKIALVFGGPEIGDDLWIMNADGSQPRKVTKSSDDPYHATEPAWSPDGSQILFVDDEIYVINTDGSGLRQLTDTGDTAYIAAPTWSPDGSTIAFVRWGGGNPRPPAQVWAMNADGSGMRPLADGWGPDWSPDGDRLVFSSHRRSNQGIEDIYVMNADGSGERRLAGRSRFTDHSPAWSPDGSAIVFVSQRPTEPRSALWLVNADGSAQRRLTEMRFEDAEPTWQPVLRR